MKAIILAAGRGSRISNVTNGGNKCLLKVNGQSILKRNVTNISNIDVIKEIIIVVGHLSTDVMMDIGNECNGKRISYCIQREQKGLIDALESAKYSILGDDCFLLLGDEVVINNCYSKAITDFKRNQYSAFLGVFNGKDKDLVRKTYTLKLDNQGEVIDLIEKPKEPFNSIMGTGNILLKKETLDYIEKTPLNSKRGEKELVDFLKIIIEEEKNVKTFEVGDHYINLNTKDDYDTLLQLTNM